jgi:hypothetical protein
LGWTVLAVGAAAVLSWPLLDLEDGLLDLWMDEHRLALNSVFVAGVAFVARVIRRIAEADEHSVEGSAEQRRLTADVRQSPPAA